MAAYSPSVGQGMPQASLHQSSSSAGGILASGLPSLTLPNLTTSILVLIASVLVLEQTVYRARKGNLPGDTWTIPIIGRFADSLNPTLENYQRGWKFPLSAVSVFHIFIVMASSNEYARKILTSAEYAEPCLTASAKQVISPDNWVFLHGKEHQEYRRGLNLLFTRRALAQYLQIQDRIYRAYFKRWMADPNSKPEPYAMEMRDLNMETSLRVFCGNYIPPAAEKEINDKYWLITVALELVNFPLALPGTKTYRAIKARKLAQKWFEHASCESKKRMAAGGEVECLIDGWVKEMMDTKKAVEAGEKDEGKGVRWFSDVEMAKVVFSFLFASQDAMSSAVVYAFQHLADHPAVFQQVRDEVLRVRHGDIDSPMTLDNLDNMPYTRAVVKESMRLKPPVIMVPYMTRKPFPITDSYTVPKGAMCIPSFWNSLHDADVYPEPDEFRPERWLPGGVSENSPIKNFIVYGAGPHRCIGAEYSQMHVAALIGTAAMQMDWYHEVTADSEKTKVIATILPADLCRLKFSPRAL